MKRTFLFILTVLLICGLFCACGNRSIAALQGLTDPRGSIPFKQSDYMSGFLETAFADYYVAFPPEVHEDVGFVQVQPKGINGFVPLCSKPNCAHNDRNCNASAIHNSLGYCNDRLFLLAYTADQKSNYCLASMLPDGTDRKEEVNIPHPAHSDGSKGASYIFVFHENKLLVLYMPDELLPLEEQIQRLYVIDLETNKITEPFQDYFTPMTNIGYAIQPVGSVIYADAYFRSDTGELENWWIAMDMENAEVRKLFSFEALQDYSIENGVMYYIEPGVGIMEYDIASGETVNRGLPVPDGISLRVDGELVYILTNEAEPGDHAGRDFTLYILNRDYAVLDTLHLGVGVYPRYTDKDFFYFTDHTGATFAYRLDKSQIGTGKLELEPIG